MTMRTLLVVAALAMAVAACGGGGDNKSPTPTAAEPQTGAIGAIVAIESEGSEPLLAEVALPDGVESPPAVVLANAGPGRVKWRHVASALVDRGFAVLAIDIRSNAVGTGTDHAQPSCTGPNFRECGHYVDDALRDIYAGVAYLRAIDEIDGSRIGVVGVEQAGYIAYVASSAFGDVATFVSIAPQGFETYRMEGIASGYGRQPHSILYLGREPAPINGLWTGTQEPRAAEFFELDSDDALLRDPVAIDAIVEWLAETL